MNRVILIGNLTRDPELRVTPNGITVARMGLAVQRSWTNQEGQREADFFTIVAWRKLAELCGEYLRKGRPVAVEGKLQSRSWETPEGQKRSVVEVVADNIQFLGSGPGSAREEVPEGAPEEAAGETPVDEVPLEEDVPF